MFSYSKDGIIVSACIDTRKVNAHGKYPVKIRVNYKRVREYFPTGKVLTKEEWETLPEQRSRHFKDVREDIQSSFELVKTNVELLADKGEFSIHLLKTRMGKNIGDTLNEAIQAKIDLLTENEQIGTMSTYKSTLRFVSEFAGNGVPFNAVTPQWLTKCEMFWLKSQNYTTIGIYMRNIRAMMNEAKKNGIIKESQYPFGKGKYEIKTGESRKKALTIEQIGKISHFEDGLEATKKYRDLWMFSYFCNGINVADLLKLKYSNIVDDEICFVRQKTERTSKKPKVIRATLIDQLKDIITQWGNPYHPDNYIFPFLNGNETALERKKITQDVTKRINKKIKRISQALGFGDNRISTYTARHSYATVLKRSGANIYYISESMGHSDLKTTEHYLASFEPDERRKNSKLLANF
jgi:Site-specific recombinase XerD